MRQTRITKGLEIEDLAEETKISLINLRAMEADDFGSLPPVTFARGLYTIYAKVLGLDADDILARYTEQSNSGSGPDNLKPTPTRLSREVGAMAERPPAPPTSLFGIVFIVFILLIALGCWYYSINPASFVSEKLRSLQDKKTETVSVQPEESQPETVVRPTEEVKEETVVKVSATEAEPAIKYTLEAYFPDFTMVILTLDDSRQQQLSMMAGQRITWEANQAIELTLPENTTAQLKLNNSSITLPASENGTISLSIPEYLFE